MIEWIESRSAAQNGPPAVLKRWLQERRLAAYYVVALLAVMALIATTFQKLVLDVIPDMMGFLGELGMPVNVVGIGVYALQRPAAVLVLGFVAAPTFAAITVARLADGWPGVRKLLRSLHPWPDSALRQSAVRCYAGLLVAYLAIVAGYLWIAADTAPQGTVDRFVTSLNAIGIGTVFGLLITPLIDEGGLFQELGWRGFALPLLQQRITNPLRASVVLGLLWWAWYLPREFSGMAFGVPFSGIVEAVAPFLVYLISLSILITYCWFRTGGSVLPAIWIHGGASAVGRMLGGPVNEWAGMEIRYWIAGLAALGLLLIVGPALGAPEEEVAGESAAPAGVAERPTIGSYAPVKAPSVVWRRQRVLAPLVSLPTDVVHGGDAPPLQDV